ncbi:type II and III secretion system protein family protein [Phenylobacterium sp.]|uniref:type II and III secretion system protein family protein n=1 Tax=Phenylobacterium sp. TaxID=1871053 RepID=UPI00272F306D|nr:type II and III secretion system protein family protein [Phenylobacterium sp.]MDP1600638.1 type II and III secretion system protein family protein [Phenylobacterium sp.]MDP3593438.1 type II and III secretion system protein family protein [Phenylobacterium sp.]
MKPRSLLIALAALGAMLGAPLAAAAQTEAAGLAAQSSIVRVNLAGGSAATQSLNLPNGKSAIVELPVDVRDVLVSNPGVADAMLRSPRRIFILGLKNGSTDAVFFDAAGRRILTLDIRVDQDPTAVAQTINRVVPGSRVRVDAMNESLILSGQVESMAAADKAVQIARAAVAKPELVLNMLSIAGKDQVMLKVRIVEMQRDVIKQLGFNLNAIVGELGSTQFLLGTSASFGVNGALLGGGTATLRNLGGRDQGQATLQAFERVGLVRTLAEPNLTAVSGESAKFLAGGEFPIPVSQDEDGGVGIEFKPFGVGLGFTPVVLSSGRIALKISTEVSELTSQGAFALSTPGTTATLTIPALIVRRAETAVELPSGGSMMIAGLLQEKTKQNLDSLPGMTTLPVLGSLFRSRDYLSGESELVIIVTPYIVGPTSPDRLQTPVDGLQVADDASTLLLGSLSRAYNATSAAQPGRSYQGPYGYVIE